MDGGDGGRPAAGRSGGGWWMAFWQKVGRSSPRERVVGKWKILLSLWLLVATSAFAASPDPVTFGIAVERGDARTVRKWLDEGMPADYQADRIGTGLMIAAWNGNIEMMELFLSRGANPRRVNNNGEQAVAAGRLERTREGRGLAARTRCRAQPRRQAVGCALHYAVFNGHTDLAADLIKRGANVNARAPNGSTPLMMAAREGHEEAAKLLPRIGADTSLKSDSGATARSPFRDALRPLPPRQDDFDAGEFDIAVKAPKESYGEASRSAATPARIDDILRQIREANAEGRETSELRKQPHGAIAETGGRPSRSGWRGRR